MSEYIILVCACGNVSGMSDRTIDIAEFLRVEIQDGWREIRERGENDAPPPADLPIAPPGAETFEFRGICAACAERVRAERGGRLTASEVIARGSGALAVIKCDALPGELGPLGPRHDYEYYKEKLSRDDLCEMSIFQIHGFAFFMACAACAGCVADALTGSRTMWLQL